MDSAQFNNFSWIVIVVYLGLTTWIGVLLAGRQATIRDFFLGGRQLPWYAVSGSIVATELSAMTLVGVPVLLWAEGGNMTYAILGIGTIVARVIVGFWFVPKFYEQEIYSPYEYIGNRLGGRARRTTSLLFMLGGMLGQGARVLMTALVLDVVTGLGIHQSIWLVGAVAVLWTFIGGIRTVIWTDLIQFCVFTFSAVLTLAIIVVTFETPAGERGIGAILGLAAEAGKLQWLDTRLDPRISYTLLAGLVAQSFGGLAAYGTDQMLAQRMFCCRGPREARLAIIASSVGQLLMLACLFVGVGLWAYYRHDVTPMPEELAQIEQDPNRLLPVFIKYRVHWFFGGLMVAGIFAAAISSLNSILAALAQQSLGAVQRLLGETVKTGVAAEKESVHLSRLLIIAWGLVLCTMASAFYVMIGERGLLIELALSVVGLAWGGILGAFLMALVPWLRREATGMEWAALLSVLTIFALARHEPWAQGVILAAAVLMPVSAGLLLPRGWRAAVAVAGFMIAIVFINREQFVLPGSPDPVYLTLGFPYYVPLGTLVMIAAAWLICRPPQPAAGGAPDRPAQRALGSKR